MSNATIQRIQSLHGLPVFAEDTTESGLPHFRKHNLIYGFNGCGKTTLSKVFACLGNGGRHEKWPDDCNYRIKMTDGNVISPGSGNSSLSEHILVFNEDFIKDNLRWAESEASPIFLQLGDEAIELKKSRENKERKRKTVHGRVLRAKQRFEAAQREFGRHKRDRARLIETEIDQARQYNATLLANDYSVFQYKPTDIFSDSDALKAQQDILKRDDPLPKRDPINVKLHSMQELICETRQLITQTLGTVSIATLRDHDAMLPWVKAGLEYHTAEKLKSCLFCGNELTEARVSALESAIDDRYDTLISQVANAKQRAEELSSALVELKSSLPSPGDIDLEHRAALTDAVTALREKINAGDGHSKAAADLLERKSETPNTVISPDDLLTQENASNWEASFKKCLKAINEVISAHNKSHHTFQKNHDAAKGKIKRYYLAEGHEEYLRLEQRVMRSKKAKEMREYQRDELDSNIDEIRQQMRQHGPAAEQLNAIIQRYLGHK